MIHLNTGIALAKGVSGVLKSKKKRRKERRKRKRAKAEAKAMERNNFNAGFNPGLESSSEALGGFKTGEDVENDQSKGAMSPIVMVLLGLVIWKVVFKK